jgi:hypothetical protein
VGCEVKILKACEFFYLLSVLMRTHGLDCEFEKVHFICCKTLYSLKDSFTLD